MKTTNDMDDDAREFLRKLFLQYYNKLMKYVLENLTYYNVMVAEDIVQSVYLEATRKYKILVKHPNPVGWLMTTGKYKLKAWKRRGSTSELSLENWVREAGSEDFRLAAAEIRLAVETVLNANEQELFRKYYIEGYSAREMAELECTTENAFKMRIFRIRDKVRRYMKDNC